MLEPMDSDLIWMVVLGFLIAFILAFGIGANDVANSFGTSVGAKVLTLRQACIIASIFELAGAVLIGARVSDTVRKGIIDINSFNGTEELAMAGSLSALTGTGTWLLIATYFKLPVSGTHSVVGATMGFALVAHGLAGVKWKTFGLIAASWIISPIMSGLVSSGIFVCIRKFILNKGEESFECGLKSLPVFYAFAIFVNSFSVFYKGSHILRFNKIPTYGVLILTFGLAILTAVLVYFFLVPYLRQKIVREAEAVQRAGHHKSTLKSFPGTGKLPHVVYTAGPTTDDDGEVAVVTSEEKKENGNCVITEENDEDETRKRGSTILCNGNIILDPIPEDETQDLPDTVETMVDTDEIPERRSTVRLIPGKDGQPDVHVLVPPRRRTYSEKSILSLRSRAESVFEAKEVIVDDLKTGRLFSFLQILTASFGAFAHGGNDVSNAIGPLISLWVIFKYGVVLPKVDIPVWILVIGGVGISIGLWLWGRRVIKTIGEDLTPITPSSGFTIEIGSALTVLVASNLGIPISTTHCKVGSVVIVGRVRSKIAVDWKLFRNVVLAWVVTMPIAGGLSAAVYAILREVI